MNEQAESMPATVAGQSGSVMDARFGGGYGTPTFANASALEQAAVAEVMVAARLAQLRPRNYQEVRAQILDACANPRFAEAAIYKKPVGDGAPKRGFSIRFAEEAARAFGNIKMQALAVDDTPRARVLKVIAWDLERVISWSEDVIVPKRVERRSAAGRVKLGERLNSQNQTVFLVEATDDEVEMLSARAVSYKSRNVILRLIPEELQMEAWDTCEATEKRKVNENPQAELAKVCDGFRALHVYPRHLEQYLGHVLDVCTAAEVVDLRQKYRAIRDGETTWAALLEDAAAARARVAAADAATTNAGGADASGEPKARRRRGRKSADEDKAATTTNVGGVELRAGAAPGEVRRPSSSAATASAPASSAPAGKVPTPAADDEGDALRAVQRRVWAEARKLWPSSDVEAKVRGVVVRFYGVQSLTELRTASEWSALSKLLEDTDLRELEGMAREGMQALGLPGK